MNWIPVFKDEELDQCLRKEGIVKFKLGDASLVKEAEKVLRALLPDYDQNIGEHFYGSVSLADIHLKAEMHRAFASIFSKGLDAMLCNHKLLTYFYLVKVSSEQSVLNIHQDWSIVDERKYRAYNLWIPLVDSTLENGTLYAMKGSQNFPLNIRGANIPPKFLNHFDMAKDYLEPIEVKKGEALIFDSRLLHYSPPNLSGQPRTAVINNIIPQTAETYCFSGVEDDGEIQVKQYSVPEDLFIHYDDFNNQKDNPNPKGVLVKEIDYANTDAVKKAEFSSLIKRYVSKNNWLERIKSLIS